MGRSTADLLRAVGTRITTPLLPDDYLHLLNPLWTARELRGKVVEVVPETENAATLVIRPGWGWAPGIVVRLAAPQGSFTLPEPPPPGCCSSPRAAA